MNGRWFQASHRNISKTLSTIKFALGLLTCLTFGPSALQAAEVSPMPSKLIKLRISQSTLNTRAAIFWIAQEQGFFAKNGLDVEIIFLQSSNLQTAVLATDQVQIGTIGGATVLSGVAGGQCSWSR